MGGPRRGARPLRPSRRSMRSGAGRLWRRPSAAAWERCYGATVPGGMSGCRGGEARAKKSSDRSCTPERRHQATIPSDRASSRPLGGRAIDSRSRAPRTCPCQIETVGYYYETGRMPLEGAPRAVRSPPRVRQSPRHDSSRGKPTPGPTPLHGLPIRRESVPPNRSHGLQLPACSRTGVGCRACLQGIARGLQSPCACLLTCGESDH